MSHVLIGLDELHALVEEVEARRRTMTEVADTVEQYRDGTRSTMDALAAKAEAGKGLAGYAWHHAFCRTRYGKDEGCGCGRAPPSPDGRQRMPSDKVTATPWTLETYRKNYDRLMALAHEREADRPAVNVGRYVIGHLGDANPEVRFGMTFDGVLYDFVVKRREASDAE